MTPIIKKNKVVTKPTIQMAESDSDTEEMEANFLLETFTKFTQVGTLSSIELRSPDESKSHNIEVSLTGPNEIEGFVSKSGSIYRIQYFPTRVGSYTVQILIDGAPFTQIPSTIDVLSEDSPSQTKKNNTSPVSNIQSSVISSTENRNYMFPNNPFSSPFEKQVMRFDDLSHGSDNSKDKKKYKKDNKRKISSSTEKSSGVKIWGNADSDEDIQPTLKLSEI